MDSPSSIATDVHHVQWVNPLFLWRKLANGDLERSHLLRRHKKGIPMGMRIPVIGKLRENHRKMVVEWDLMVIYPLVN